MNLQTNSLCRVYGSVEVGRITAIEPFKLDEIVGTCFVELSDGVREVTTGSVSEVWPPTGVSSGMGEIRLRAPGVSDDGGEGFA